MFTARTATRTAAVFGATAALTVAGAGVAAATTHESTVDGNTVSVTFTLDDGLLEGDACGAVLTPTSAAAGIAAQFAGADDVTDITPLLQALINDENVTVLRSEEGLGTPAVVLGALGEIGNTSGTATATDVPPNVYALVSYCLSDDEPTVEVPVLVGDPMEAIMGSIEMGSAGGGLDTLSSVIGGGEGELGVDTMSSALGGEGELDLGVLSSAVGGGEGEQTPEA